MKTALLVIDVQNSFLHKDYWEDSGFDGFKTRLLKLIDAARGRGWAVVYIRHNEAEGVFSKASGLVELMSFLDRADNEPLFDKHVHNALTESGLHEWLQGQGIKRLLIAGIRTEQCCETTTRVASDLGYEVEFVLDATLTFPMHDKRRGQLVSAQSIMDNTALVLAGRFATITQVSDYGVTT